ncbi:hypothetical protein UFOVP240_40 [uncultured Caudovirales phage]|uniref:Uncharacterized protein n=1 Tax=uncultured Caudovirales phage TaxID=2100421 RepID=A0A6J7WSW9_9CAUD|nr:hypothetical protein UFOVP240_40 [uncultured Caudovirales phage]
MNARIKLLAEQAYDELVEETGNIVVFDEDFQQRFAQLIVQECVKLQYKNVVVGGVSDYNRGRRELAEEILKHFGVEE